MSTVRTTVLASLLLLAGTASIAEAQPSRPGDDNRRQASDRNDRRPDRTPARPGPRRDARDDNAGDDDDDRRGRGVVRNPTRATQPARTQTGRRDEQRTSSARPSTRASSTASSTPSRTLAPNPPAALGSPAGQALVLTTNDAQQQIEVVIGPADGQVKVVGINGGGEQNFSNVGSLRLVTGASLDAVTFAIRTPVPPQLTVETGLGESDVKFVYDVVPSTRNAVTNVLVLGGPQNDKVLFEGVALSRSFASTWAARLGEGDNEVVAKMNQPNAATFTNVWLSAETGSGQDKVECDIISNALAQDLRVSGSTGAGNDSGIIKFDGQRAATTAATFGLDLGAGQDQAESLFISRGGQVTLAGEVRGGEGDDTIKMLLEGNGIANATLQGDGGNDYLDMELKGNVRGETRHLGGAGDDFLKLIVVGPRRIVPFMDGGPGIDAAIGFGTIVNVEQVDRQ
jgi:hypothetical protein